MDQIPSEMTSPQPRSKRSCLAWYFGIVAALTGAVFATALLSPVALWVCGNSDKFRSYNNYYGYYSKSFWEDFWAQFWNNLANGGLAVLAIGIFCATTYGCTVWLKKIWGKTGICGRTTAISVILCGFVLPGLLFEPMTTNSFDFVYHSFLERPITLLPTIQALILVVLFLYRKIDQKMRRHILESVQSVQFEQMDEEQPTRHFTV